MLLLYIYSAVLILALTAIGFSFGRLWGYRTTIAESGLLGMFVLTFIGLIANFFIALSPTFNLGIGLVALVPSAFIFAKSFNFKSAQKVLIALPFLLFWICGNTIGHGPETDTGLYELPMLNWITHEPIIVGLANLHGRFGYNSLWTLLCGISALPVPGVETSFLMNVVLIVLFLICLLEEVLSSENFKSTFSKLALLVLLFFTFSNKSGFGRDYLLTNLGTMKADGPAMLLYLLAILFWIKSKINPTEERQKNLFLALLFSVMTVMVKTSYLPIGILTLLVIKEIWTTNHKRKSMMQISLVGAFGLTWVFRTTMLSGCLIFPADATCFHDLAWTMSKVQVQHETDAIRGWARKAAVDPQTVLHSWGWVADWAKGIIRIRILQVMAGLFLIGQLIKLKNKNLIPPSQRLPMLPVILSFIGIIWWFFAAPDFRFSYPYWIVLYLYAIYPLWFLLEPQIKRLSIRARQVVAGIILILVAKVGIVAGVESLVHSPLAAWPVVPEARLTVETTEQGTKIQVPTDALCWAAPVPCTPYFNPKIYFEKKNFWQFIYPDQASAGVSP